MLSKSQYTRYIQCPKLFWLSRRDRRRLTDPDAQQLLIFENGHRVGEAARQLFPGGEEIPLNLQDLGGMAAETARLIEEGAGTIYEAAFIHEGVYVAVDILHSEGGSWHIYEVKSSTEVKDVFVDDAAVQAWVLEGCGIPLRTVNIVHINNRYVRDGDLDLEGLFTVRNISERIATRKEAIPGRIAEMKALLEAGEPEQPIGPHCLSPYECDAKAYCWKELSGIPDDSVFTLANARREQKFEWYDSGIIDISSIPTENLSDAQKLQVSGKLHIEADNIREFVSSLDYPLAHLDFESFQQAIPEYQGIRAYSQIPFQYSVHIEEASELLHREYLAPVGTDPRRELAEGLLADLPLTGSILVYNQVFEKGIINKLSAAFADLAPALSELNHRIRDLALPFARRWYYHPAQNGSWSIKKVLPALVPDMADAYKALPGVNNGGEASAIWSKLPGMDDGAEVEEIRRGLLAYCRLDTLAMVRILDVLRQV